MARAKNICPPGILCITPTLVLVIVIFILIIAFGLYVYHNEKKQYNTPVFIEKKETNPIEVVVNSRNEDGRYSRAPKPLRNWLNPVELPIEGSISNIPVMATRGLPESYQSMGVIQTSSGELLPLYGRRVASRSDRFNYYTRTDTNNPLPLPIRYKKRDCQDDVGCDELFDNETIQIIPTNQTGKVNIYRFNGPTYIPGLI
jgi:hypothetical protein